MTEEREFFSPERVDEQIDQLSQNETHPRFPRQPQAGSPAQADKRLVKELRGHYWTERQEDIASLERAWKRVSPHLVASAEHPRSLDEPLSSDTLRISHERNRVMYNQVSGRPQMYNQVPGYPPKWKTVRWPGLLAAVLVAVVLVGGLITVLNLSHQAETAGSSGVTVSTPQPRPTAPPQPIGTTVYTTPGGQGGYTEFAWSPDSTRIAALVGNGNIHLQIWDAITGRHVVTVSLPDASEWIVSIAWSPVNQDIALGTNQHLLIVDSQTGAILHSYASSVATIARASGSPYLSSQIPTSGGFGYRSLTWSPDGKSLAASISFGASGSIQVWNMQTGTVKYTLSLGYSYVISSVAWSSDGQYLAGHGFNTQNGGDDIVATWSASTHKQVFTHKDSMDGSDASIYWQPQSHNLAFDGTTVVGTNLMLTLEIWDTLTGQELHKFVGKGGDPLAWSSDGKQLAYNGYTGSDKKPVTAIVIMDVSNGAQVYAYTGSHGALAWSPDGKYIVSSSGGQFVTDKNGLPIQKNGAMETTPSYAKVWIA